MKHILKVTILFTLIVSAFIIPSFADSFPVVSHGSSYNLGTTTNNDYSWDIINMSDFDMYLFVAPNGNSGNAIFICSEYYHSQFDRYINNTFNATYYTDTLNSDYLLYEAIQSNRYLEFNLSIPFYASLSDGLSALRNFINNPPTPTPTYTKNDNVDEFIANTLISMGVKFDTPAYALSFASAAWDWCIDEINMESAHPFDEWSIDSFVSYCNAQSNNYLNWYNGYKVSEDVTKALGEYIRQNIRSLTGLPAGVTSLTGAYLPIYHYGSGFQSGVSSPTAQTFYPAQTITYFNGEYVNETDDISTSQFLYTPADVRRFLGYPGSSPAITPSSPTGTGTITDDPNNPDQKNITINFPSLDWLADAIKSILDFLRNALTTIADLLTQLLDAILGLFSDAFASLADFGQGIIEFLQSVFAGLSTLLNGYVPSDLAVIITCFIALNFGIGLITFILKGH